ncbi:MAG: TIGR02453 family protein [Deltaproteobacteria bacterium]|jgi:uncharacterized protein (TIGR02453 family)|nr:TIGR02453 family protein [Deltaproteobacteria bacterium]
MSPKATSSDPESPKSPKAKSPAGKRGDLKAAKDQPPKAKGKSQAPAAKALEPASEPDQYFSQQSLDLLKELGARTSRGPWYEESRERIERFLMDPARRLIETVGREMRALFPDLVVDPKVDRGIYRLYRDTRFSHDKSPYKDHLGIVWWKERPEGKLESPSFYFHLTPHGYLASTGVYRFPEPVRRAYVRALADERKGRKLMAIAEDLALNCFEFDGPESRRWPKELDSMPWSQWGRRRGLCAFTKAGYFRPDSVGPGLPDLLTGIFKATAKLFAFLSDLYLDADSYVERPPEKPKTEEDFLPGPASSRKDVLGDYLEESLEAMAKESPKPGSWGFDF